MSDPLSELPKQGTGPAVSIVDVTAATFETLVIAESQSRPVIVDFWAPWCGPCKQLGPILESVVKKLNGRVLLGKVNTEQEQQLAAAFGISSIPMVVAIVDGQIVDQFVGVLPEPEIEAWVNRIAPSKAQELLKQAALEAAETPDQAIATFRQALEEDDSLDAARIGLARCLIDVGQRDEAASIIELLEKRGFLEPEAEQVKSILEIPVTDSDDVIAARTAFDSNPDDLRCAVALAEALAGSQQDSEALLIALEVVRKDRDGVGQEAKAVMLRVFDRLGSGSPLVTEYRRKLATLLY